MRSTKSLLLLIAFVDYLGVGLIYPMFSSMLFDYEYNMLSFDTPAHIRGFYLGLLLSIMPLALFLSAPWWGAVSDKKGRKSPLILSLILTAFGYFFSYLSILISSLWLLILSRFIVGFASGNTSIIQASLSDLSTDEEKTKNFALYNFALGTGFTLGPFVGGFLSRFGYSIPFLVSFGFLVINILLCLSFYKDTIKEKRQSEKISFGFDFLKHSLMQKSLRGTFIASFFHNFGWSYFFEFIPIFLFQVLAFTKMKLGTFYAIAGLFYAVSAGIIIRPFLSKFKPLTLFQSGLFMASITILFMSLVHTDLQLYPALFFLCFFVSLISPSATAYVSSKTSWENQGKILGSLSSTNALAYVLSPLISGTFVGKFPKMPLWFGGAAILVAAFISIIFFQLDKKHSKDA